MKFKLGQKVTVPQEDLSFYHLNERKIKPYGVITRISPGILRLKDNPDPFNFYYKVHLGDGVLLTFHGKNLKPYVRNTPDDV